MELLNREAVINFLIEKLLNHYGPDLVPVNLVKTIQHMTRLQIRSHYFHDIRSLTRSLIDGFQFVDSDRKSCISSHIYDYVNGIIRNHILTRLEELNYYQEFRNKLFTIYVDTSGVPQVQLRVQPSTTAEAILHVLGEGESRGRLFFNGEFVQPHTTMEELGILPGEFLYHRS